ncbi:alpha/beta fold hydrolase [Altererythrobacter confluentis]|uniref:Alpha/beta fold hydrolase n=1 Tax=Allopontixanthobacter confluentis TaxID=1849021 RepID=A0A6L7GFC6_9SPHN|nr:alpha/beta hydrolase [Allopontixanthobacter confluentis]MXP13738.1 alpha/beta fold hydrolase [Allopontixanthobacter confluentis]
MDSAFDDRFWQSPDGLTLHFRDYPAADAAQSERPPLVCMHGLTRNARDFAQLADRLSGKWRVIVPEMRGRGESEYAKDPMTYNPLTYVADVEAMLEQENIGRFVAIGTSLGGLMTMLLAAKDRSRIAGALLNDIGPVVDPAGIDRIREYVGQGRSYPSWMHAARALQDMHGAAHPEYGIDQWLEMAKRGLVLQQNGRIGYDYDMRIAEPFQQDEGAAPPDLWPAFQALENTPLTVLRGELSDLLTAQTLAEMKRRIPQADVVTVAGVGHAPMLDEPEAAAAIDRLLGQVV